MTTVEAMKALREGEDTGALREVAKSFIAQGAARSSWLSPEDVIVLLDLIDLLASLETVS